MRLIYHLFYCFVMIIAFMPHMQADNRIVMYLSHPPHSVTTEAQEDAQQADNNSNLTPLENQSPSNLSKSLAAQSLRSLIKPKLGGFVAIYGGYMDISESQGLISFPLRQASKKLYLAITPHIALINVKENTFAHREYVTTDNNPLALYVCELKQDQKGNTYWTIATSTMPQDKKINPLTIVILTDPKNIYVPTGDFLTAQNQQLVLPDLFVVGRSNTDEAALQSIDLRGFFEPIKTDFKKTSDVVQQNLISNI